jgi:hypothetical protein
MRVHKTSNFTVMSNYHFKEKKMSLKAKGLLSLMLSLPDDWNYSVSGLCTLSKDGKDSVMSALAELEKFGYLTRERVVNEKGQFSGIEYNIYEQPQKEKPIAEKPISANECAEKPIAENRTQLNTNSIKDLFNELYNVLNTNDDELLELYKEYIKMRETIEAPLTTTGLRMLIERCSRLAKDNIKIQKLLLENAIINNWKNVYLPNEEEVKAVKKETVNDFKNFIGIE